MTVADGLLSVTVCSRTLPSMTLTSVIVSVGAVSLSVMTVLAVLVPIVALPVSTFVIVTSNFSSPSNRLSLIMGTLMVAVVLPAGIVTVWVTGAV